MAGILIFQSVRLASNPNNSNSSSNNSNNSGNSDFATVKPFEEYYSQVNPNLFFNMKTLYYGPFLLLFPILAHAQTQPMRFKSPVGGVEFFHSEQVTPAKTANAKPIKRTEQNRQVRDYWDKQEAKQQGLADDLSKFVNDSIQKASDVLDASTVSPLSNSQGHAQLDAKRIGVAARIAPYQRRIAYCAYQRNNVNRLTFAPVRSRQDAPLYFNAYSTQHSAEFLAKSLAVINPSTGKLSLYNELYGDYVGWWRVAFGTTLVGSNKGEATTAEGQKNEAAIQRLVAGGGNALITAALPLASFHTDDDVVAFKLSTLEKIATDLPQTGAPSSDFAYHSDLGLELTGYYQGFNKIITPFMFVRAGKVWGNSLFYDNLGRNEHNGMLVGQVMGGLSITDVLLIAGTYYYGSSFIRDRFPFSLSITLQPKTVVAATQ